MSLILKIFQLINNQTFIKYFKNTTWLFAEKIFRMGLGFIVLIWITRYLGPERFGLLSYSQSLVSIVLAFASLGLDSVVIRELVKNNAKRDILLGTAFYLKLFASFTAILFIIILNEFCLAQDESKILINIISFSIIFNSFNVIDMYFQSHVLSKYVVYSNSISFLISSIVKIFLIYNEFDLIYFAYSLVLDSFMVAIGYLYIYKLKNIKVVLWKYDKQLARNFLRSAWPLVFVAVSAFVYTRIDQIMIKYMIDAEAVGNYAAAVKVSELFYFIPAIIVSSIFPKVIEAKQASEENYLKLLEKLYRLVVWIAIPIAICMSLFSSIIIDILYGEQYSKADEVLALLSWGIVLTAIGSVFVKMLYAENFEKKYLYKSIFGMLINIFLNYILLPIYGIMGAAIATLITLLAINYIYDLFDSHLRKFYYLKFICFIPFFKK